jgi:hypothetical protein
VREAERRNHPCPDCPGALTLGIEGQIDGWWAADCPSIASSPAWCQRAVADDKSARVLSQPVEYGGVGFGTVYTSALFLAAIIVIVVYTTMRKNAREIEIRSS